MGEGPEVPGAAAQTDAASGDAGPDPDEAGTAVVAVVQPAVRGGKDIDVGSGAADTRDPDVDAAACRGLDEDAASAGSWDVGEASGVIDSVIVPVAAAVEEEKETSGDTGSEAWAGTMECRRSCSCLLAEMELPLLSARLRQSLGRALPRVQPGADRESLISERNAHDALDLILVS
ncbi:hypothetical protein PI124_g10444 [Phytophthora idaei]|nr:hypothetical protein PI124_g10444 [Phytophthora idaei]